MTQIVSQTNTVKWHLKKIWSIVSKQPQRQQRMDPFHPFVARFSAVWSLLLSNCHRKNLIFRRTFLFQINTATLLLAPLSVRNLYIDLVVNWFFLSRAHKTLSALLSIKEQSFSIFNRPNHLSYCWTERHLLNSTPQTPSSQQSQT
jgi:hypothetical protein